MSGKEHLQVYNEEIGSYYVPKKIEKKVAEPEQPKTTTGSQQAITRKVQDCFQYNLVKLVYFREFCIEKNEKSSCFIQIVYF